MLMKFINFLIDAYERLFPKGLLDFAKLEKKFKSSEKLMSACKKNNNILKIPKRLADHTFYGFPQPFFIIIINGYNRKFSL